MGRRGAVMALLAGAAAVVVIVLLSGGDSDESEHRCNRPPTIGAGNHDPLHPLRERQAREPRVDSCRTVRVVLVAGPSGENGHDARLGSRSRGVWGPRPVAPHRTRAPLSVELASPRSSSRVELRSVASSASGSKKESASG